MWLRMLIFVTALLGAVNTAHAAKPGGLLWSFKAGGPIWSSLTYDNGTLYFGSDDGALYALDTAKHRPKWRFPTRGKVRSQPALSGALVYAASDDGFLYAVERATGRQRWRFDLKAKDLGRRLPSPDTPFYDYLQSSPLVRDEKLYIGSLSGTLFAIDATRGALDWKVGTATPFAPVP